MSSSLVPLTSTFASTNTQRAFKTRTKQAQGLRVSCNSAPDNNHNDKKLILPNVDRRNLLVGLGGLYTAANLPGAIAAPITAPDITSICKEANSGISNPDAAIRTRKCCPPDLGKPVIDFVFPTEKTVRKRWPAHKGTQKQMDDYRRAIAAMRALEDDDPDSRYLLPGEPNPLYDIYRDPNDVKDRLVDLDYDGKDKYIGPSDH